jgi:quinol-cytochrome oxidoreductase complex cytochrome b subunit
LTCITGQLLPWHQTGFWQTTVTTTIPAFLPVIGEGISSYMRGGEFVTGITLSRFFSFHVVILPVFIVALLILHVLLIRRQGLSTSPVIEPETETKPPADFKREAHLEGQPCFPHFSLKRLYMVMIYFTVLFFILTFFPNLFQPPEANIQADPMTTPESIRPAWYFLAPYQIIKTIRPFWNASILAPRFLASAFCSGPAVMMIIFQIVRKVSKIEIDNKAIFKIAELVAYAMGINLFLLAAEFFKEFYSGSIHLAPMKYLYFGLHGHNALVPWMWTAMIFNITAFFLFLRPKTRENLLTLNIACVLIIIGVYIEKGMGLTIPGFVPGTLGEIYEYSPTFVEKAVTIGVWATGALIYTLLMKFAIPVYTGELRFYTRNTKQ